MSSIGVDVENFPDSNTCVTAPDWQLADSDADIRLHADDATISFSDHDISLFSRASGDVNPLHTNPEYSRSTPYGQPVVFGCLSAFACLAQMRIPRARVSAALEAHFLRPVFLGVTYRVEMSEDGQDRAACLFDGSLPVLRLTLTTRGSSDADASFQMPAVPVFERRDAAEWERESTVKGLQVSGGYSPDAGGLAMLAKRWGYVDPMVAMALCWSSYLVGMELPGKSALFSKLVLDFDSPAACAKTWAYRASVTSVDPRINQIRMGVSLKAGDRAVVSGQCWSFMRSTLPSLIEDDSIGNKTDSLIGRTTVLIGGSRGLGAAMKHALEMRGAAVYSLARSGSVRQAGRAEVGDAADPRAMKRLRERVLRERERLDFLICNACPPILPLRLEANATERIGSYIREAISITLTPLCAFLELLNEAGGCAVIVSSTVVDQPVREWPHYGAAKQAIEALARVAVMQYPRVTILIVRPQKLLTTLTNTPMGRLGATSPAKVADRIAARLESQLAPGEIEILN